MVSCTFEPQTGISTGLWDGFLSPFLIVYRFLFGRGSCDESLLYDISFGAGVVAGLCALYFLVKYGRSLLNRCYIWLVYGPRTLAGIDRARSMYRAAATGHTTAHKQIVWRYRPWVIWLLRKIQRRRLRVDTV